MVTTPRTAEVDFATKQFLRQFCLSKIAGFSARTPDVMQGNRTQHCEPEAAAVRSPSASVPPSRTYPPRASGACDIGLSAGGFRLSTWQMLIPRYQG